MSTYNRSPSISDRLHKVSSLFRYGHLPAHLQVISKPFCDLAVKLTEDLPHSAEYTLALRSLWEAKNLAVFATVEASMEEEEIKNV